LNDELVELKNNNQSKKLQVFFSLQNNSLTTPKGTINKERRRD